MYEKSEITQCFKYLIDITGHLENSQIKHF